MKRPRVAVFTRAVDEHSHSGSGQHWHRLLSALATFDHGLDITFVHHKPGDRHFYEAAVSRGIKEMIVGRNPVTLSRALNRHRFELIHYHLPTIFTALHGVRGTRIATIHGAEPVLLKRYYKPLHVLHDATVVPLMTRAIDHIVTVSHTTEQYLRTHYPLRRKQTIDVITNGVDPIYRPLGPGPHRVNADLNTGAHFFFHVSKFSPRKNPWTLIRGFHSFLKERESVGDERPWRLVIAGKGWDTAKVRSMLGARSISDRVILAGFVREEDLPSLYSTATGFIFPSFCEGFGMPNLEAMASGCPVITTDAFAIPEVVGDAALIVSTHDIDAVSHAMSRFADDVHLRRRLAGAGLERARQFSWSASAERLIAMYHRLYERDHGKRGRPSLFDTGRALAAAMTFVPRAFNVDDRPSAP